MDDDKIIKPKPTFPPNFTYNPGLYDPKIHSLVRAFVARDQEGLDIITDKSTGQRGLVDYPFMFFKEVLLGACLAVSRVAHFLDVPMSTVDSDMLGPMTVREGWLMAEHETMLQRFEDLNYRMIKMEQTFAVAKKRVESQSQPPPLIQPASVIIGSNRHERRAEEARRRKMN